MANELKVTVSRRRLNGRQIQVVANSSLAFSHAASAALAIERNET